MCPGEVSGRQHSPCAPRRGHPTSYRHAPLPVGLAWPFAHLESSGPLCPEPVLQAHQNGRLGKKINGRWALSKCDGPLPHPPTSSAPRWGWGLSELEITRLAMEMFWGRGAAARRCRGSGLQTVSASGFRSACGWGTRGSGAWRQPEWETVGWGGRRGGWEWKWELAVPALFLPVLCRPSRPSLVSFVGPRGLPGGAGSGGVIDVSLVPSSAAGSDHAAVADRDPLAKEHQGACHAGLRHPGVRPHDPETFLPPLSTQRSQTSSSPHLTPALRSLLSPK